MGASLRFPNAFPDQICARVCRPHAHGHEQHQPRAHFPQPERSHVQQVEGDQIADARIMELQAAQPDKTAHQQADVDKPHKSVPSAHPAQHFARMRRPAREHGEQQYGQQEKQRVPCVRGGEFADAVLPVRQPCPQGQRKSGANQQNVDAVLPGGQALCLSQFRLDALRPLVRRNPLPRGQACHNRRANGERQQPAEA